MYKVLTLNINKWINTNITESERINADNEQIKWLNYIKLEAGKTLALVGPTGIGKTTMVNLLMKFYDINSGGIKIDGLPINKIKRYNNK